MFSNDKAGPRRRFGGAMAALVAARVSALAAPAVFFLMLAPCAALFLMLAPCGAQATDSTREATVVVGRVSTMPHKQLASVEAMATYLADRLGGQGIVASRTVFAKDADQMAAMLRDGQVDVVSETPYAAVGWTDRVGAELLAHEWKDGAPYYRAVFLSRRSGGVMTLDDLRDRKIAFADRHSTSAYLVPLAMLRQAGLEPVELANPRDPVPTGKVGYSFAGGANNMVAWVARGIADAGAFSNLDWDGIERTRAKPLQALRVFQESPPVLRSLLLTRRNLRPDLKAALLAILFSMHEEAEGQAVLKAYNNVGKYEPIGAEAAASLMEIRRLMAVAGREPS